VITSQKCKNCGEDFEANQVQNKEFCCLRCFLTKQLECSRCGQVVDYNSPGDDGACGGDGMGGVICHKCGCGSGEIPSNLPK